MLLHCYYLLMVGAVASPRDAEGWRQHLLQQRGGGGGGGRQPWRSGSQLETQRTTLPVSSSTRSSFDASDVAAESNNNDNDKHRRRYYHNNESSSSSSSKFVDIARGGRAELLIGITDLTDLHQTEDRFDDDNNNNKRIISTRNKQEQLLMELANKCRLDYLSTGIAHLPNFLRQDVVKEMVDEAVGLKKNDEYFYSTDRHTVYQEDVDMTTFPVDHPRNVLQKSSKYIIDYDRIVTSAKNRKTTTTSPLVTLYESPELKAFISYVVRPPSLSSSSSSEEDESVEQQRRHFLLYRSGCKYNAAYYNVYDENDGLGWHFDRSEFGVNLELQRPTVDGGGNFELCYNTRRRRRPSIDDDDDDKASEDLLWGFENVLSILRESSDTYCPCAQRVTNIGPGSLVIFSGSNNLHRVTPVVGGVRRRDQEFDVAAKADSSNNNNDNDSNNNVRINAIMTYETSPNQKPNSYSLRKFFGR